MHHSQATLVLILLACSELSALAKQPEIRKEVREENYQPLAPQAGKARRATRPNELPRYSPAADPDQETAVCSRTACTTV